MNTLHSVSRRRALKIVSSAVGLSLLPRSLSAARSSVPSVHWRGVVMNAPAEMHFYGVDQSHGKHAIRQAILEAKRLEKIFSIYDPESAVRRLNQNGYLTAPPLELVELLNEARAISNATEGAFDATMQPLWDLYAAHFSRAPEDADGPPLKALEQTSELVDYRMLDISAEKISFARQGMAVSVNGIAQGYVTDRITGLLRSEGFTNMSVDLGEARVTGSPSDGGPWQVSIKNPMADGEILNRFKLTEGAVATSQPAGTVFEKSGRHHHLFDPRTGYSVCHYRSVTVTSASATRADGLSTGLSILPPKRLDEVVRAFGDVRAIVQQADGSWIDTLS